MTDDDVVRIFGLDEGQSGRTERGLFRRADELRLGWGEVPAAVLRERVEQFVATMGSVLDGVPAAMGEYRLEQVQISAEISAKGQVSLLGTGGELAGKSGLTFTFVKKET
ncbi:hypothetical protein KOI35_04145 [Actinoplanes bogorensis]|uniref:Pepco domain-containing protein n=1 Tax=Paractinoplanes bogorensis TaxID=1610840 RepID=A0ABS5YGV4_9ACTN|nr:hypothetical protein [Actinoplanes bogorensis]MBU2662690.1 hypothetical protein [Actinoplanes bogorensis]